MSVPPELLEEFKKAYIKEYGEKYKDMSDQEFIEIFERLKNLVRIVLLGDKEL